jgi:hypothetical protein
MGPATRTADRRPLRSFARSSCPVCYANHNGAIPSRETRNLQKAKLHTPGSVSSAVVGRPSVARVIVFDEVFDAAYVLGRKHAARSRTNPGVGHSSAR